jgi:hypothetical protein
LVLDLHHLMSMSSNSITASKGVISSEPDMVDYDRRLCIIRSVATIGIILGTAGLMLMPFGLTVLHEGALPGDPRIHLFDMRIESLSIHAIWLSISSLCGVGLALLLLVGSAGALRLRHWARPILLLWAVCSVILAAGGCAFNLRWLFSTQRAQFAEVRGVVDALVSFGGWGIGSALAIALLLLLSRPHVRATFARDGAINPESGNG